MRPALIVLWLLLPILFAAYHFGPGQQHEKIDDAAASLADAQRHLAKQNWQQAIPCLEEALKLLPPERTDEIRLVRLEKAKAQMHTGQLPQARSELESLVDECSNDANIDPKLLADARSSLANAQYYVTWILRLEGEPKEIWEPEIDSARQNYRLLVEQAKDARSANRAGKDLEAAIRLARMDLSDLQGLPLPSQCKNCKGGECKKCACKKPGKKPGGQKKKEDARGASSGPPPDNTGS